MHPLSLLSPSTINIIRDESPVAETQGKLTFKQLEIVRVQKWFYLFVPEAYGGIALSLPEAVRLEEELAFVDGSLGWVVTLCAGAALFIGYFNEGLAKELFNGGGEVCIAGSGQATGTAKYSDGGFEINGSWPYASGAAHATHFTGNCLVEETGLVQSFIFRRDEVLLQPNWNYLGLNATAGYSYTVKNLRIPISRTFSIDAANAVLPDAVYRYPFLQLAETTIAANIHGMCACFLHLARQLLLGKPNSTGRAEKVQSRGLELIVAASRQLAVLRDAFYAALDSSWTSHTGKTPITQRELAAVTETSIRLATESRNLVNQIYPYCGMNAARTDTGINQVWRNINTASQHSLLLQV